MVFGGSSAVTNLTVGQAGIGSDGLPTRDVSFKIPSNVQPAWIYVSADGRQILYSVNVPGPFTVGQVVHYLIQHLPWNATVAWKIGSGGSSLWQTTMVNGPSFITGAPPVLAAPVTNLQLGPAGVLEDGLAAREVSFVVPSQPATQYVVKMGSLPEINIPGPFVPGAVIKVVLHGLAWATVINWSIVGRAGSSEFPASGPGFNTGAAPVASSTLVKNASMYDDGIFTLDLGWVQGSGPSGIMQQYVDVSRDPEFKTVDHAFDVGTNSTQAMVSWAAAPGEQWYVRINEMMGTDYWIPSTSSFMVETTVMVTCAPPTNLTINENLPDPQFEVGVGWTQWVQWQVPDNARRFLLSLWDVPNGDWIVFDFPFLANGVGGLQEVPLRGLIADRDYDWIVQTECNDGGLSTLVLGPRVRIVVNQACLPATELMLGAGFQQTGSTFSKNVAWRIPSPAPDSFEVGVIQVGVGTRSLGRLNAPFSGDFVDFTLTGLLPATNYQWFVNSYCSNVVGPQQVLGAVFTTPQIPSQLSAASQISVTPYVQNGRSAFDIKWSPPAGAGISAYFMDILFANSLQEAENRFNAPVADYPSLNLIGVPISDAGNGLVQITGIVINNSDGSPITAPKTAYLRITNQFQGSGDWYISPIVSFQVAVVISGGGTGGPIQKFVGDLMAVSFEFDYRGPAINLNLLLTVTSQTTGFNRGGINTISMPDSGGVFIHGGPAQSFLQVDDTFPGDLYDAEMVITDASNGQLLARSNPGDFGAIWNV